MKKEVLKRAFVATVPVLSGYLVIGLSFGVVLQSRGYGALWSAAMSAFIYAGSMQFVAVELMSSAASLITALEPLLSPVWVALFCGEMPGRAALPGMALVLASVLYSQLGAKNVKSS